MVLFVCWGVGSSGLIWLSRYSGGFASALAWLPVIALPLIVPSFAAASFAREYEQQTWQDLYLTRLTNLQVVTGKFWAAQLQAWLLTLAFLPCLVLALERSSEWPALLHWALVVAVQLFISSAFYVLLSMGCSRYCATRRGALIASYTAMFIYGLFQAMLASESGFGSDQGLPTPFTSGFMQSVHLIFCAVVGIGSAVLIWVSMSEQRGYRSGGESAYRAWQPVARRGARRAAGKDAPIS